jgi:hypothetical protein
MAKAAYIKIIPSQAKNIRYEAGEERLQSMTREEWIVVVESICALGEGESAGRGVLERLREEHEDDKGIARIQAHSLQYALEDILKRFRADLEATYIPEQDIFYLEYDPTEWFATPGRSFGAYLSGRMFALAAAGVLQAQGIPVYGTGLAEEPADS